MENLSVISRNPSVVYIGTENIDEDRIDGEFYNYKYLENEIKLKKSGVKIKVLNDVIERMNSPIGWQGIPSTSYLPHGLGVPLIRVQNVSDLILDEESLIGVEESIYDEQPAIQAQANDIIITRVGTIGRVCRIPEKINRIAMGQNLTRIKLKETLVESGFMLAYMSSKFCQIQMERYAYGGVQASLTNRNIKQLLVPIPSPEIQKYIGDKVRKAEELREEAKTLQKEIDILLEVDMLLKEETDKVYNIYDSKINWTNEINIEDRIDPNFYQKKYISTIEKLGNNKVRLEKYVRITKIRYQTGNINKYIEISSINNSFGTIDEVEELRPEEIPTSAKYQVKEGDILVSLVRPTRKAISIVTKEYDNAICTGGFAVLQSKGKVPVEFLTAVLRTNFVGIQFERYCAGSTYPTINEDDVVKVFIPMYSENQINKITENYRRIIDNIYTSKKLIEEAKQDVEDLIEGNFDMSKVKANS
ncbi:EcoKI restriction-modification system protein HsdS [Clostridium sp. N3C]|uniref:restriction endonuclease subunit S n=1 Tax=Clostridium sp. N3C TaxID=1776758 RepID=UPI00092DF084|nr:restriction endonuclease subunit S [Clostridium sp. N3C]SCN23670.1 EcoKI restriction-modification system protein HsdS [Clostridium sp. N3C]